MRLLKRMWVNQPSTLQRYHHLNGARVLYDREMGVVYFTDGPVHSQEIEKFALSEGWPKKA